MTRPGALQRCAMHFASFRDFKEAELVGKSAVNYVLNGEIRLPIIDGLPPYFSIKYAI